MTDLLGQLVLGGELGEARGAERLAFEGVGHSAACPSHARCSRPIRRNLRQEPVSVSIRQRDAARVPGKVARPARPMGAADRRLRLHQCDGCARGGGQFDRALACRQATVGHRRHAGRYQGHHRDRRYADRNGLAAFFRLALGEGRGLRARAARRRRGHSRQDGNDGIRRIRAARHAQSVEHRAHAGRLVERFGGVGRRRHRQRGARYPGDQLDRASGELLRLRRLQADGQRAQPPGQPRLSEPKLHRHPRRFARRRLAGCP